jgi:RHS repeat-associated protein
VLSETYSDGTETTFTYDSYGNLTTATNSTGTTTLTYNSQNLLTEIKYPDGTSLQYTYNSAGQRLTMTDQTGYTVNYSYNALGELSGLSDASGSIDSYTYDQSGQLSEEIKGNGTSTKYTYDAAGDILSVINFAPDGSINSSFIYTYNDLGLCTTETTIDGEWVYSYDATGQVTQAVFTPNAADPDGLTAQNLQYVYDPAGNRTQSSDNGVVTTYTVNDMNQYTTTTTAGVGTTSYQYDGNGNLTSQAAPSSTTTYTYNINNQLTGILAQGGVTTSYQYDPFGTLYSMTQNGQMTQDLVDPILDDLVAQFSVGGNLLAHYTYGQGLVSQISASGTTTYYDFDALGSTAGLSGSGGTYVNTYTYLPFGGTLTSSGSLANLFQFVSQWGVTATTSGLNLMDYRLYSPTLGRFTAQDPRGLQGGDINLYRYVFNDPVQDIDPKGTDAQGNSSDGFFPAMQRGGDYFTGNYTATRINNITNP